MIYSEPSEIARLAILAILLLILPGRLTGLASSPNLSPEIARSARMNWCRCIAQRASLRWDYINEGDRTITIPASLTKTIGNTSFRTEI
jgi:hypothetical protein